MHVTFFDREGIIFDQPVPRGQTVNGEFYLSVLRKVRRAVRDKRPQLHEDGPILLHDNAAPHRCKMVQEALCSWGWEILLHPPYSPDLSPCDFFLFPRIKEHMRGKRFSTEDEVNGAFKHGIAMLTKTGFQDGIHGLVHRWMKCVALDGAHIES